MDYSNTQDNQDIATDLSGLSNEEIMVAFADGLLNEKGLGEMSDEVRQEMLQDLVERLSDFVNRAILEALPEEKIAELDELIDRDVATPEAVSELINGVGFDVSERVAKAMEKFREIYLGENQSMEA